MNSQSDHIRPSVALGWIVCLAFLSVGARNFESGISLDGPLYATIARNIVRTGEWFRLDSNVPDFRPFFAEHPHLGFWLLALIFKMLPAADWAARILGHLFYVGFLWMFFLNVRKISGQTVAAVAVFLLWTWYQFSNTFSNVYLDPGTLFFGTAAIFSLREGLSKQNGPAVFFAGFFVTACLLYKGLTVLGFLPAIAFIFLRFEKKSARFLGIFLGGVLIPLLVYLVGLYYSRAPDFFAVYWSRQMTHRFGPGWKFINFWELGYWKELLRYSYFLAPLAVVPLLRKISTTEIPAILLLSFIAMFAPARLWGGQYLTLVLPWLAWLIALNLKNWKIVGLKHWIKASAIFSLSAVFMLQYIPVSIHGDKFSPSKRALRELSESGVIKKAYVENRGGSGAFFTSAAYAWYGDVTTEYVNIAAFPKCESGLATVVPVDHREWESGLSKRGWCPYRRDDEESIWLCCRG
jgi:4-amino-4-deoxy-L-arabinose transferase-like glycosyltransferase